MTIGTYPPQNVNGGPVVLGYAERTSNLAVGTTNVDGGISVTATVASGRRIKITAHIPFLFGASGALSLTARIKEDSTVINIAQESQIASESNGPIVVTAISSPTRGTHTYSLELQTSTGTTNLGSGAGYPAFLLVEDITGNQLPVLPQSVPVGVLAYAETTTLNQPVTGAAVSLPGLSVNVVVPAGRLLRVKGYCYCNNSAADNRSAMYIVMDGTDQLQAGFVQHTSAGMNTTLEGEVIVSPSAGAHTFHLNGGPNAGTSTFFGQPDYPAYITVEDITPTPAPGQGAPGSTLGYSEMTADITGVTTTVTVLAQVTVTVPAGRRIRVRGEAGVQSSVADDQILLYINEGSGLGTTHRYREFRPRVAGVAEAGTIEAVLTPAAGTYTYRLMMGRGFNATGTLSSPGTGNRQGHILVEDITGAVWPVGSSVTAGMVASEPFNTWTPVITQSNTPAQTINRAVFTKVGRLWTGFFHISFTSAGTATNNIFLTGFPVSASNLSFGGSFRYFDAGNTIRAGTIIGNTTTQVAFVYDGYGNSMGFGDFVIANGDMISGFLTFEAAS